MEALALALGAALAVACVLLAARPFLREPTARDDTLAEPGGPGEARVLLEEERDRALADLKELEFDHRTGKISDEDYRAQLGPLRARAADTLRALGRGEATGVVRTLVGEDPGEMRTGTTTRLSGDPEPALETPPEPARVPEPWPPPDEGDLPDPAPTPTPGEPMPAPAPGEPVPPTAEKSR